MKKIILVLTILTSVFMLSACNSADSNTDLEERVIALEEELEALEARFDNLVITTGINGQTDYYENDSSAYQEEDVLLSLTFYELAVKEDDYLDKSKFPDYIWSLDGNYVSVDDLANLLVNKYFNGAEASGETGSQFRIDFFYDDDEMSNEEYIARLSLLVMELSSYDFYTIDSSQLYFYLHFNLQTIQFKSRMSLLVTDKYTLDPAIFYGELLDVSISGIVYDFLTVQALCDEFILNETFIDYVLDYN